jgi:hypothetical protein
MKTMFAAVALAVAVAAPSMASAQEIQPSKLLVNPSAVTQHNAQLSRRAHRPTEQDVYSLDGRLVSTESDPRIRQSQYFDVISEGN